MKVIYLEQSHSNDCGYYGHTHISYGREYLNTYTQKHHKRVKIYKTERGLAKGIKYLTENWISKELIRIEEII